MAKFAVDQRIKVPTNNPTASATLKGKEGVVTSVGTAPPASVSGERTSFIMEQQYFVRFDDAAIGVQMMFEKQIEAA